MNDHSFKSRLFHQLQPAAGLMVALLVFPSVLVLLKPLLALFALSVVTIIAVRGLLGYLVQRRQYW